MELPFDSERKMMSTINEIDGKYYLLVKGGLDNLLEKCSYYDDKKINNEIIEQIKEEEKTLAKKTLRVIAFAYKEIKKLPKNVEEMLKEEDNLNYIGIVGIMDPPRENVKESVRKCLEAGIRPIMITGDSLITACAIAKEVGILKNEEEGLLGEELDKYTDEELKEVVKKYNVYARVSPTHKTKIVNAWQANGKVVAMTGDGVNDAPALKEAHVGIGMGITGTEVTKSVADVILLDDSFSTIVVAVEEGRRIFSNIRNNVVYSLSSNFAELFIVLIGMFTGNTILLPIHILFIDLVTDTVPSICLSFEQAEKNIMKKEPRGINKPLFTKFIVANIIYSALIETLLALIVFFVVSKTNSIDIAISATLLSVVIQEIIYAISCRNLKENIYKQGVFSNKAMNIGLLIVLLIEALMFLTPIGSFIGIVKLDLILIIKILLFNLFGFILYEIGKPVLKKYFKD